MDFLRNGVLLSLSSLVLSLLLALVIKMLHKLWWIPIQMQRKMAAQGIKGPAYGFFHGSTTEMLRMKREATSRPMSLSHDIFPYVQPHFHKWAQTYGRNFLVWHGPQAFLVVSDLDMVKEVLNDKDHTFSKIFLQDQVKKLVGDGLVTSEGEQWAKHRKLANFAFHGGSLKSMVPAMVDCAHIMIQRWRDRECLEIDVYEEFKLCTSDAISKTAFGSSYVEGKTVFENVVKLGLTMAKASSQIRLPGVSKLWKPTFEIEAEKLEKGLREAVLKIIKRRQQKMNSGEMESYGNDFLGLLLTAMHDVDENKKITFDNVIAECKTFYSAGFETLSSLLAWTVFLLAIHTDWQQEARKEVLDTLGDQDPDFNGTTKLKKMGMIINESLRLYPPGVGVPRKVTRQAKLGDLILPAGIMVHIPILKIHHDPQIWGDDAHLFKPERFSEGVAKATNNNPAKFLPFGLGPRNCVGLNFATVEAKIVLAMILQRFSFTLSPAYVHSPVELHNSRPQYGVQVILNAT
ncbi:cytochrome P450 CYP749A22-like isoform X2 [Syzygium oleosum]|uniref:cytochrome P450 CYP749A22-like isoform X2 n=1 Tax=Syzygium oleosum TaxID=219896 RepID=UPI0011D27D82|nr:cytochrome P450 CYP749A22-like isoform X2 [Syzygium oleosum]XP_056159833.1 cytochrome P450 CYP749A22-like isoform X2 [Syzygium oleosum]